MVVSYTEHRQELNRVVLILKIRAEVALDRCG